MWKLNVEKTLCLNGRCLIDTSTWFHSLGECPETLNVGVYKTENNEEIQSISMEDWQSVLVFEHPDKDWFILLKRMSPSRKYSRHHSQNKSLSRLDKIDFPSADETFIFHVFDYCMVFANLRSVLLITSGQEQKRVRKMILDHAVEFMSREGQSISEKCARDLIESVNREDAIEVFPTLDQESRSSLAICYSEKNAIDIDMITALFPDFEDAPAFDVKSSDWTSLRKLHDLGYTLTETFPIRYAMWSDKMGHPVTDTGCFLFTYRKVMLGLGSLRPFCDHNLDHLDGLFSIVAEFARCS